MPQRDGPAHVRARAPLGLTPLMERTLRFLGGLGLVVYEAVVREGEPRWPLLLLYSLMMGSPLVNRADEIRRETMDRLVGKDGR